MSDVKVISSLPAKINRPGNYKLCRKLHYNRDNHSGNAITITSDNVSLDGNNAKIKVKTNGTQEAPLIGVLIQPPAGTTISNVKIFNLFITAVNPSSIASSNFVYGIVADHVHKVLLKSLTLTQLTFGVILSNAVDVTIDKTLFGYIAGIPITTPIDQTSAAIDLDSNTQDTFIKNCTFNNPPNLAAPLQSRGITTNQGFVIPSIVNNNIVVENCSFEYFAKTALFNLVNNLRLSKVLSTQANTSESAVQFSYQRTQNFVLEDSVFYASGNGPVGFDGIIAAGTDGLIQNVVLNTDSESSNNSDAALNLSGAQNVVVKNVTISGTNSVGVLIGVHSTPASNITLDGVQVNDALTNVIVTGAANVVIKNSDISNNPSASNVGIALTTVNSIVIRNNNFQNNVGGGIVVDATSKGIADGNEFVNSPHHHPQPHS